MFSVISLSQSDKFCTVRQGQIFQQRSNFPFKNSLLTIQPPFMRPMPIHLFTSFAYCASISSDVHVHVFHYMGLLRNIVVLRGCSLKSVCIQLIYFRNWLNTKSADASVPCTTKDSVRSPAGTQPHAVIMSSEFERKSHNNVNIVI